MDNILTIANALVICAALLVSLPDSARAEQMQKFGPWEVHYVLVATTFLKPEIAATYGITRGRDLAMLNVSVLNEEQQPTASRVTGHATNLLGQRQPLAFKEVREGSAIYYLATVRHTDQEVLRFNVMITPPDDNTRTLEFQQRVYWDR